MTPLELRLRIADAAESGRIPMECTAEQVCEALRLADDRSLSVGHGLKALGYEKIRKRTTKRVKGEHVATPALWRKPVHWPTWVDPQRRLRDKSLSPGQIHRATDIAFKNGELLEAAIERLRLDRSGQQPADRGALKRAMSELVNSMWYDSVSTRELADALGEDPSIMNRKGLVNRTRGLARFADRD